MIAPYVRDDPTALRTNMELAEVFHAILILKFVRFCLVTQTAFYSRVTDDHFVFELVKRDGQLLRLFTTSLNDHRGAKRALVEVFAEVLADHIHTQLCEEFRLER